VWVKESDYQAQEARRGESTEAQSSFSLYGEEKFAATGGIYSTVNFHCRVVVSASFYPSAVHEHEVLLQ
jgi:hypothetical protein